MKTLWVPSLQRDVQSYFPFRFIRLNCSVMHTRKNSRFVWIPSMTQEILDPIEFQLGSISDISEFADCRN